MKEIKEFIEKRLEFEREVLEKSGVFDDDWEHISDLTEDVRSAYRLGRHHGAYLTLKLILKKLQEVE